MKKKRDDSREIEEALERLGNMTDDDRRPIDDLLDEAEAGPEYIWLPDDRPCAWCGQMAVEAVILDGQPKPICGACHIKVLHGEIALP